LCRFRWVSYLLPPPPFPFLDQLEFYQALFRVGDGARMHDMHLKIYRELHDLASSYLRHSAYHVVDASVTFAYLDSMKKPGQV
jgi:hypothetical protein